MEDRALAHREFVETLQHYANNGKGEEKELARIALAIYELTSWHPPVIDFVNAESLRAIEEMDEKRWVTP